MAEAKGIACVTGASGLVGRRVVRRLVADGYDVRVLIRAVRQPPEAGVEIFRGSLDETASLERLLESASLLFHCAAELRDESRMWEVNVDGTERLLEAARTAGIRYCCHLSSAGVVGLTELKIVDESAACNPQNTYERSKWAAEQLVARGIPGRAVVILRPTNVIDDHSPGALALALNPTAGNRLKLMVKGGECAHIVHAENVAQAALHFVARTLASPERYFVSCDDDPLNTFAGLWALYRCFTRGADPVALRLPWHLPLSVPHALRRVARGAANPGDVRYTSRKLLAAGFRFPLDLRATVRHFADVTTRADAASA